MNKQQQHGEDTQPNENLSKRVGSNLPPVIRSTAPKPLPNRGHRPYRGRCGFRGGFRGKPYSHSSWNGGTRGQHADGRQQFQPQPRLATQGQGDRFSTVLDKLKDISQEYGTTGPHPPHQPPVEPIAGPSNVPTTHSQPHPEPKRKRKRNRAPHAKNRDRRIKSPKLLPQSSAHSLIGDILYEPPIPTPSQTPVSNSVVEPSPDTSQQQKESNSTSPPASLFETLASPNMGTLHISPLPLDCNPTHPLSVVNTSIWIAMKRTEIVRKGFTVIKTSIM